jgi:PAS domain S-box-containing protein
MEGRSGMAIINSDGSIISVNEGVLSILGFDISELINKSIFDFIESGSKKEIRGWLDLSLVGQANDLPQERFSFSIKHKSGTYIDLFSFIKIIELNNRKLAMVILECHK